MLNDFQAHSDIRGERIDLGWTWTVSGKRPSWRLVRRRRDFTNGVSEGLTVVDLDDAFDGAESATIRVERHFYIPINTVVESALPMAELELYYNCEKNQLYRTRIGYYDGTGYQQVHIDDASSVVSDTETSWRIFDGSENLVGQVTVSTEHEDGDTSNCFEWQAKDQASVTVDFAQIRRQRVTVILDENFDPNSGDFHRTVTVQDDGLEPQVVYYYALFENIGANGTPVYRSQRDWRAAVMATGRHGLGDQLYRLLPNLHAYYDEPEPSQRGQGPLRRLLQVFGAAADQARSLAEGLEQRHDIHDVHAGVLPHLASLIGWESDLTANALTLRNDVLQAPEIFRTVGTVPNLRALVNRITGWDCKIKEFANNVFLTNAPETIRLWEIYERVHDGNKWEQVKALTRTDGFDGRPVLVNHSGSNWLVFHADRSGNRDLWFKPGNADLGDAYVAELFAERDDRETPPVNEHPASLVLVTESTESTDSKLWLFWSSNRDGRWDIWGTWDTWDTGHSAWNINDRPFANLPKGTPANLTEHAADDRNPVAVLETVLDEPDRIWLFWQSNRRGPTDIWAQVYDPSKNDWNSLQRVTRAEFRHEHPAVTFDGNRLWLFFSDDLGDRCNLGLVVKDANQNGAWSEVPLRVTQGHWRDEAPTAVFWNDQIWLFWHSNRDGHWQIWGQVWEWKNGGPVAANEPFPVTTGVTGDKEPMAFVDTNDHLRLVWRSQRRGTDYRSRTIDTKDTEMLARLGSYQDRAHYTYDTGRSDNDWYARDTVGIFITPESEHPDEIDRSRRLIEGPLRQFIPINVRLVLVIPDEYNEHVYTYDSPDVEPQRTIDWDYDDCLFTAVHTEHSLGVQEDSYTDSVPGWSWLHACECKIDSDEHRNSDEHRDVCLRYRSVNCAASSIDITQRTWHVGVLPGD